MKKSTVQVESHSSIVPPKKRSFFQQLIARKSFEQILHESENHGYKRDLGPFDMFMIGVGGIIGAGIFVLTGVAAKEQAGPAVVLSFVVAGFISSLAALCYAELASMLPIAGSAYTFTYATMDISLEYLVGAATVAVGWAGYLQAFIEGVSSLRFDSRFSNAPFIFKEGSGFEMNMVDCVASNGELYICNAYFNVPAFAISIILTIVLFFGIRKSVGANAVFVVIKVVVILVFIFAGIKFINPDNYVPFIPEEVNGKYGVQGIFKGATTVFFAYIGFDAVTTTAQEAKNPQRDIPIGVLGSLVFCTVMYISVSAVLTGLVPYDMLELESPVSSAIRTIGLDWLSILVEVGAIAGLTSSMLISLMGQPRVFQAMSNDGLLPKIFGKMHPRYKTPYVSTIITGLLCGIFAGLLPIDVLGHMTSIGTLFAFMLVCLSVLILRFTKPDAQRGFKIPGGKYGGIIVSFCGAAASAALIFSGDISSLSRILIWMGLGLLIYMTYGFWHSKARFTEVQVQVTEVQEKT